MTQMELLLLLVKFSCLLLKRLSTKLPLGGSSNAETAACASAEPLERLSPVFHSLPTEFRTLL